MSSVGLTIGDLSYEHRRSSRRLSLPAISGAALLAASAAAAVWAFHTHPFIAGELASLRTVAVDRIDALREPRSALGAQPAWVKQSLSLHADLEPLAPAATASSSARIATVSSRGPLIDPASSDGAPPLWLQQSLSLQASLEPVAPPRLAVAPQPEISSLAAKLAPSQFSATAPLPPVRPAELRMTASLPAPTRSLTPSSARTAEAAAPAPAAEPRSFFGRIFGAPQPSGPVVAYAAAESGDLRNARSGSSGYDRYTAVYDISAHVVYMPNGARLEAHSGYGDMLDDPRHVAEHMRGATPPNVYELEPREQSFHGVDALRLKPVGGSTFGRAGLLAHSFMLGPNGDSNGCVSFKDYDAFLQAYRNGQVKRLAVVAKMD
jgi:hypothetical protein